jgi:hypothetical protein
VVLVALPLIAVADPLAVQLPVLTPRMDRAALAGG